jgi:hypothetical protein
MAGRLQRVVPSLQGWDLIRAVSFAFGVTEHETRSGVGWDPQSPMAGSRNMGAIQHKAPPCIPGYSALLSDTNQTGKRYPMCFRVFPDWDSAADEELRQLFTMRGGVWRSVLGSRSIVSGVWDMYSTHYFGGFTTDASKNVSVYVAAISAGLGAAAKYLNYDPHSAWEDWYNVLQIEAQED